MNTNLLQGAEVVFTGELPISRQRAWELARAAGATVVSTVKTGREVVVYGEWPGSRLMVGRAMGCRLLDAEAFRLAVGGY